MPGLYLTKAHFVDDFEGWLKGGPEFEVHILGQKGQTDSLTDYQCAGEKQPAPYYFDQNALDWSGSVMLFSKVQLRPTTPPIRDRTSGCSWSKTMTRRAKSRRIGIS